MQESTTPKASFVKRAVAFVIDIPVMLVLSYIVAFAAAIVMSPFYGRDSQLANAIRALLGAITAGIMVLFQFLYFGFFWSRSGQSIGMKFMAVKVARRDGSPVGFFRSALRGSVGYWISGLVFFLGFIWAAFDPNGEAWHDKIFDTRVIEYHRDPYGNMNFPGPRQSIDAGPDMR